jgi:hypothetical protein
LRQALRARGLQAPRTSQVDDGNSGAGSATAKDKGKMVAL